MFQGSDGLCWKDLLRIKSAHKLLYALEIIEALGKPNRRIHRESTVYTHTQRVYGIYTHTESLRYTHTQSQSYSHSHCYFHILTCWGVCVCVLQGSYSDLYPDSDDSSEDQIENSKNSWSCKVSLSLSQTQT